MLKKRIIANLTLLNGVVVQSIGFNKYLPVGKPEIAVEFLNQWGIDEIIISESILFFNCNLSIYHYRFQKARDIPSSTIAHCSTFESIPGLF